MAQVTNSCLDALFLFCLWHKQESENKLVKFARDQWLADNVIIMASDFPDLTLLKDLRARDPKLIGVLEPKEPAVL